MTIVKENWRWTRQFGDLFARVKVAVLYSFQTFAGARDQLWGHGFHVLYNNEYVVTEVKMALQH